MKTQQLALIKKDIRSITSNKQVLMVMLMVPLALTIVLPSILVYVTVLVPESASDFQRLLDMLPVPAGEYDQKQMILGLMLNKILPAFFSADSGYGIVCYGGKLLCGRKGKAHIGNPALFAAFLKAAVSSQNTGWILSWYDGFIYLVCCNDACIRN